MDVNKNLKSKLILILLFGFMIMCIVPVKANDELSHSELPNSDPKDKKFSFQFDNTEISDVIKVYSRETQQKFILDSQVRAKVNILATGMVSEKEAFHLISKALANKGYGIVQHGGVWVVKPIKQLQRDLIPVVTQLPDPIPERMLSLVITLKYIPMDIFKKKFSSFVSREAEEYPMGENKIVITDWISNLYRIQALLQELDKSDTQFPTPPEKKKTK